MLCFRTVEPRDRLKEVRTRISTISQRVNGRERGVCDKGWLVQPPPLAVIVISTLMIPLKFTYRRHCMVAVCAPAYPDSVRVREEIR